MDCFRKIMAIQIIGIKILKRCFYVRMKDKDLSYYKRLKERIKQIVRVN